MSLRVCVCVYMRADIIYSYIYMYLSSYTHSLLALFWRDLKHELCGFKPQGAPNIIFF